MATSDPITAWSAGRIAEAVIAGEVTAVEVVDAHLARIAAVNPALNAVTVTFAERSRAAAADVDRVVADGGDPGPLAGVPFTVKENIDLTWSATTNGWCGAAEAIPAADATIVRRMRDAGAVPVGRGNMPDFGMRWDTDNDLFGRTVNPWDATRSPGGSSGGDAVAVAAGMSAVGLGNDYGGSLRIPAHAAGVCGFRPSLGLVPRAAVRDTAVALTLQQFSVNGPLARSVDDLERAFGVIRGFDASDPVSLDVVSGEGVPIGRAPRRVGVSRDPLGWGIDAGVAASIDLAAAALSRAGWDVVEAELPHLEEAAVLWRRLACTDMLFSLDPDLLGTPLGASATAFLRDSTAAAQPYESAREYSAAWGRRAVIAASWRRCQQEVPVILGPVLSTAIPVTDFDLGGQAEATEAWRALLLTVVVNFLGLPSVALPTGVDAAGVPTGVQVIGPLHGDALAFAAGRDIEAAFGHTALPY